jgi:hypothetical protein
VIKYLKPSNEEIKKIYEEEGEIQVTEEMKSYLRENIKIKRKCYTCGESFNRIHFFYDWMCQECGDLNYMKRI